MLGDGRAKPVGPKFEARRAESGGRVFGERAPSPPARDLGSAVSSRSGVRGKAPAANRFVAF